jgi:uncharacterized OB-fold protein
MTEDDQVPYILDFLPLEDPKQTRIYPFYDHLREGRLTTTQCNNCGEILWPPRVVCSHCNEDQMEWIDLPKEGTVYAFTAMVLGAPLGFEEDAPFVIAMVDLDMGEGRSLRLFSRIDDATYEEMSIDQKVYFKVVDCGDARFFFRFSAMAP